MIVPAEDVAVPAPMADASERERALDVTRSFLVEAPAGSGKTGLLVQRMLKLLCRVDQPEAVLALTFTNKATAEMRERVLRALDLVDRPAETLSDFDRLTQTLAADLSAHDKALAWNLRENRQRLNIRTLDSLCGEITRSLPILSGAIGQMKPVENAEVLYRRAARAVTLRLGGDSPLLTEALTRLLLHQDADLRRCESLLASMLATREQWGALVPLTPGELSDEFLEGTVRHRLNSALQSVIFASLSRLERALTPPTLQTLFELARELSVENGYRDQPNPIQLCGAMKRVPGNQAHEVAAWQELARLVLSGTDTFKWRKSFSANHLGMQTSKQQRQQLGDLVAGIADDDYLLALFTDLKDLPPAEMPQQDWELAKALFRLLHFALVELQLLFHNEGICDFAERSLSARAALRNGDARDSLGNAPGMKLEHLLVDEMQDTSSAQYDLLEQLTAGWDGRTQTVFLVGDPKQSIYLFRQAQVERFLQSMHNGKLGQIPLEILRLSANFRSGAPLVHAFNQTFAPVFAAAGSGDIGYTTAVAARIEDPGSLSWHVAVPGEPSTPLPQGRGRRQVRREQAVDVVRKVLELRACAPAPPSIAILVRSREHAAAITRQLSQERISFRGVDLEALSERPEVLDTVALARALMHPDDRVAWLAVLHAPWCGTTLADLHRLAGADTEEYRSCSLRVAFRERLGELSLASQQRVTRTLDVLDSAVANLGRIPISELVERSARALGADLFRTEREQKNVQRCLELIETAEAELKPLSADDLQQRLARLYAEPDTSPGAIDVMTVHKAKGLEWDVVFVPEMHRSLSQNSSPLLDWLELPDLDSTGHPQVILAPVPARGTEKTSLGRFVWKARKRQQNAEVARLLYVAMTRARTALHLYAAPEVRKDDGTVIAVSGTLLWAAWSGAGAEVQARAEGQCTAAEQNSISVSAAADAQNRTEQRIEAVHQRVRDDFDVGRLQPTLHLPWRDSATSASDNSPVLESVHRPEGSLQARALGTATHLYLEQLAKRIAANPEQSRPALRTEVEGWHGRIRVTLRGLGLGGPALEGTAQCVERALSNTVQSDEGYWLLQPHRHAVSELTLVPGFTESPLQTLRLDRTFYAGPEPGDSTAENTLWIIDYKTSVPQARQSLPAFLAGERERYTPQLRNYAKAHTSYGTRTHNVMLALYFPLLPVLDCWPVQIEQEARS